MIWHDMVTTISRKVLRWCVVVFYCCSPGLPVGNVHVRV